MHAQVQVTARRRLRMSHRLVAGASVLVLIAGACGSTSNKTTNGSKTTSAGGTDSATASKTTGFSLAYANLTNAAPLEVAIGDSVASAAKVLNLHFTAYDNNSSATQALSNAQLMVNQKPDVIAEFNATASANQTIGNLFKQSGIPCVAVDVPVPNCSLFTVDHKALGLAMGSAVGQLAKAKGWTGANTTVVLVTSWTVGGEEVNQALQAFYQSFASTVPNMQTIPASQITAQTTKVGQNLIQINMQGVTPDEAFNAVTSVLPSIPSNRNLVLFGVNDDAATGALRAMTTANRADAAHTMVAADGASQAAIADLKNNPLWVAEGSEFNDQWGELVVAVAAALHAGVTVPATTLIPIAALTKDNLPKYYNSSGEPTEIPALPDADKYLVPLGVLQRFHNVQGL